MHIFLVRILKFKFYNLTSNCTQMKNTKNKSSKSPLTHCCSVDLETPFDENSTRKPISSKQLKSDSITWNVTISLSSVDKDDELLFDFSGNLQDNWQTKTSNRDVLIAGFSRPNRLTHFLLFSLSSRSSRSRSSPSFLHLVARRFSVLITFAVA